MKKENKLEELVNRVVKSTQQVIMLKLKTKKPLSIGSGSIIKYKERLFFVSVLLKLNQTKGKVGINTGRRKADKENTFVLPYLNNIDEYDFGSFDTSDPFFKKMETIRICYAEITGAIDIKQALKQVGKVTIRAGSKITVDTNLDDKPKTKGTYCFYGNMKVEPGHKGINENDEFISGMKSDTKFGIYERFILKKEIIEELDFNESSGAPIFSEKGELVALVVGASKEETYLYGFSVCSLKSYLDKYIDLNPSLLDKLTENISIDPKNKYFDSEDRAKLLDLINEDYSGIKKEAKINSLKDFINQGLEGIDGETKIGSLINLTDKNFTSIDDETKIGDLINLIELDSIDLVEETTIEVQNPFIRDEKDSIQRNDLPKKLTHNVKEPDKPDYIEYSIFYGTNRALDKRDKRIKYKNERDTSLHIGSCNVSIPKFHKTGKIERPNWFYDLFFKANPKKYFTILDNKLLEEEQFFKMLSKHVEGSDEKDILLFIHGFNVDYNEAMFRTAQLGYDLNFRGGVSAYSWPSKGKLGDYLTDADTAKFSSSYLADYLKILLKSEDLKKIHIIAHSMGNVVLTNALLQLKNEVLFPNDKINQIILAAPDIDKDIFIKQIMPAINRGIGLTLYASNKDKALLISKKIRSKYPRLGEGGDNLVIIDGLDSIDASKVDTSLMGHGYFSDTESLLGDIHETLLGIAPKNRRLNSRTKNVDGVKKPFWELKKT